MSEELKWKIIGDQIGHQMTTKEIIEMYAEDYGYISSSPSPVKLSREDIEYEIRMSTTTSGEFLGGMFTERLFARFGRERVEVKEIGKIIHDLEDNWRDYGNDKWTVMAEAIVKYLKGDGA